MASEWIKIRTDIYRDPKVIQMAYHLMQPESDVAAYVNQNCQCDMAVTSNVMRNAVVGALVAVWGIARRQGKRDGDDLVMKNTPVYSLDDIGELPGIGDAMLCSGWVIERDNSVVFPMFFKENNTDPKEDAKAKNAERQRRFRESQKDKNNDTRNVTRNAKSNARERVEKEKSISNETQDAVASVVPQVAPVNAVDAAPVKAQTRRTTVFVKPTVSEIVAYVLEINATVDAKTFWDYYESNGWRVGRNPMKDWRATVRQWQNRNQQGTVYSNGRQSPRLTAAQAREQANADAFAAFDAAAAAQSGRDAANDWGGSDTALIN
jgi:hypothetical protein